ncbi:hypothetical protein GBN78_08385 [Bacillus sp. B2-WWTP-C-10-Post-4]|uniref:hypothetical protein n=1 Tax=Bacillus sp. B2-WWTP-C-10-Post-4 TaxID=2653218 RepID=UPI0012621B14|nr:hypothetical protein [Bacillus sp. B2-WWTP-C-10-Post-4]KAB7657649.1 hypothetical protein GBN78_08385 [Bacillus sp. B2-WWTP-C-10-Post-4]
MAEVAKIESKDGNIYVVDGKRYRELAKEPEHGDKILVVDGAPNGAKTYKDGDVLTVLSHDSDGDVYIQEPDAGGDILWSTEFVIVELIEQETLDLLPRLSDILDDFKTKVTRLEERTEENNRNILTFSQMTESARSDASKAVGGVNALDEQLDLVREDIVYLDEKVSVLEESLKQRPAAPIVINIENLYVSDSKSIETIAEELDRFYQIKGAF